MQNRINKYGLNLNINSHYFNSFLISIMRLRIYETESFKFFLSLFIKISSCDLSTMSLNSSAFSLGEIRRGSFPSAEISNGTSPSASSIYNFSVF